MFLRQSIRIVFAGSVALVLALTGCGENNARSPFSLPGFGGLAGDVLLMPVVNLPPSATILSPAPSSIFTPVVTPEVRVVWTGRDPDGYVREYRYRLFTRSNPDFPDIVDFLEFLNQNPDSVLHYYEPNFKGWERVRARKEGDPVSVMFSGLTPNESYAFVVVAIDGRAEHDTNLSRDRNLLNFVVSQALAGPDITFIGPFGEVTNPPRSEVFVVPAGQPAAVQWYATPKPGMVIEGYRWSIHPSVASGEPSLDNTTATIPPPISGDFQLLYVEVEYDGGRRALYILPLSFTGTA